MERWIGTSDLRRVKGELQEPASFLCPETEMAGKDGASHLARGGTPPSHATWQVQPFDSDVPFRELRSQQRESISFLQLAGDSWLRAR
jgi:hypothetical protein